ncbi:MAG: fumarylacetoacetate hydrolase family protein [Alphaproteobacteria bacterium]|nr:fumarylacetoacetate hydrolase family protein [Alphaproteobacteria bacterium]
MRWLRYEVNGQESYGIVEGDEVVAVTGDPFAGYELTRARHRLRDVKYLVPVIPKTFYAAGLNYVEHITEMAAKRGEKPNIPPAADIGYRANNALIAHNENIVIPHDAGELVQYEAELVAVIGTKAKYLSEADALSCVLGWTIGNDMSERTWQRNDRTLWRAKNSDTFKPMGPWIETDFDLEAARTIVRVNGEETDNFQTNHMLYSVATFISRMSQYLTLWPGDVVWMGTEGSPKNLKHGDVCEIEITGIGILRNPLIREKR